MIIDPAASQAAWAAQIKAYPDQAPSPGEQKALMAMYANQTICRTTFEWAMGLIDIEEDISKMTSKERRRHFAQLAFEKRASDPLMIRRRGPKRRK
jgi:hypothetical protein